MGSSANVRGTASAASGAAGSAASITAVGRLPSGIVAWVAKGSVKPPDERPIPNDQTRPKPVAAQTSAPSTKGRLDPCGGTTKSCREGRCDSAIGWSPEE